MLFNIKNESNLAKVLDDYLKVEKDIIDSGPLYNYCVGKKHVINFEKFQKLQESLIESHFI